VIDDVRELDRRIKRELVRPHKGGTGGFDLKNGEGGIREIEFFVQALQLIHAGKRPGARHAGRARRAAVRRAHHRRRAPGAHRLQEP
jgi:glutamate-ammonia-ligase adenylyltransferase